MMQRLTCRLVSAGVVATSLLAAVPAYADPTFEYKKPEEETKDLKGVEWNASAEAGLILTTGNSETTTATLGFKVSRKQKKNKFEASGSAAYAESGTRVLVDRNGDGEISENEVDQNTAVTAESLLAKLRYDRFLTTHNSLFIAALVGRDTPAGKEIVGGMQVGYSRQLYKSEKHEVVGEFGYDFSYEDLVAAGDPAKISSARAFVGYKGLMAEGTTFETSLEVLANLNTVSTPTGDATFGEDTRANGKAAVSSKVGKSLAVAIGLEFKFDNHPAPLNISLPAGLAFSPDFIPEAAKLDSILKASLIYSFF